MDGKCLFVLANCRVMGRKGVRFCLFIFRFRRIGHVRSNGSQCLSRDFGFTDLNFRSGFFTGAGQQAKAKKDREDQRCQISHLFVWNFRFQTIFPHTISSGSAVHEQHTGCNQGQDADST